MAPRGARLAGGPTLDDGSPRALAGTIYVPTALLAVGAGMMSPALPLYASSLGMSLTWIGLLSATSSLAALVSNVPAGLLAARAGSRSGMAGGLVLMAAGALCVAWSPRPWALFPAMALLGCGGGTLATARLSHVTTAAPIAWRGRALALVGGANRIGLSVGPVIGGLLTLRWGLGLAFYGQALMAGIALLAVRFAPGARAVPQAPPPGRARARLVAAVSAVGGAFVASGAVAWSLALLRGTRAILLPLWGAAIGLDLAQIGSVVGAAYTLEATLFYPVGHVMDRYGRRFTIVPCLLILSASLACMPLAVDYVGFLAAALLGGLGNGLGSGAVMTLGADIAPADRPAEFLGVWRMVADLGGIVAPATAGLLADAFSLGVAFQWIAGVGVAGAALMAFGVREPARHPSS